MTLREVKQLFLEQYNHLWCSQVPGGINGVGIGLGSSESKEIGLSVSVESSQEVLDQIPDKYHGYTVHKKIVGKIEAL